MTRAALGFYWGVLGFCGVLVATALLLGMWWIAGLAAVCGVGFFFSGWYVLSGSWRSRPPAPTRRPVRRRRR